MKKIEQSMAGWYFLAIVILTYAIVFFLKPDAIITSLKFFLNIMIKIIPIFIIIFILLVVIEYFVKPEKIVKHLGKDAGIKGWVWAILGGIISTGPIYMWYPLLNEMQKKGARSSYMSAFLYNRAVKPALLPLFIYYFGAVYTIILTILMILTSIIQGIIVEKIVGEKNENSC